MESTLPGLLIPKWQAQLRLIEREQPLPPSIPALLASAVAIGDGPLLNVFEEDAQVSYREFDTLSSRFAAALYSRGVNEGSHVAVMLENCIEFQVTWFALAKLGAVIVPVNPSYTARELLYVLDDSEAGWLLHSVSIDSDRISQVKLPQTHVMRVQPHVLGKTHPSPHESSEWHALLVAVPQDSRPPDLADDLDRLVNIQYTSGTTGFPKGCMLTHGYWLTLAQATVAMHHGATMQRFFTAQPFFYMDPFWQFLEAIWCHGTFFAAKKLSASKILAWLAEHRIHRAQIPELSMKYAETVAQDALSLPWAFTFGWSPASREAFLARFGIRTYNCFGMTEVGVAMGVPPEWPSHDRLSACGIPALRRDARVVDEQGRPVPSGTVGELQISGKHIFKGYYRKPEINAKSIVDGWFSTGDAFVQDPDGFLTLVGRFKDMIRRSSENIAAREVEAVVRDHPDVEDCAAVPVPDPIRGEEVKILVQRTQIASGTRLDWESLIAHCQRSLAPFKVPRYYEEVEGFPRTSSNKISKPTLISAAKEHLTGYDRVERKWRGSGEAGV